MFHNLLEFGSLFSSPVLTLGEVPPVPWYQSELFVIVPTIILFIAGLLLGYILFKPQKDEDDAKPSETASAPKEEPKDSEISEEQASLIRDEATANLKRSHAELLGEKDAAERLISQQKDEIRQRDEKLALTQSQFEEKELRVNQLVSLTKSETQVGSSEHALIHAKATVIQLSETITGQRQQIGTGISRLEQIEDRVKFQSEQVWDSILELGRLQGDVAKKGGWRKKDLAAHLECLEDHLRVHHQNAIGCIQQAGDARQRLQNRHDKLLNVLEPVTRVEKRLDELDLTNAESDPTKEYETAAQELTTSRDLASKFDNGVQQEIAELDGRLDWLLNDSTKKFVTSVDALKGIKPPRNKDLRHELAATERKLSEIRTLLTQSRESPAASDAFTGPITPRRRIYPAFNEAIVALKTAALTPAERAPSEAGEHSQLTPIDTAPLQSELETLREALANEKKETEALREEVAAAQAAAAQAAAAQAAAAVAIPTSQGPNLMRRLLRLNPGADENAHGSSLADDDSPELEFDEGMTGPQISIVQLKSIAERVDSKPVNRNENSEEIESLRQSLSEKDEKISLLEKEIRQFTAPIPLPSEIGGDGESETTPIEPQAIPESQIQSLTPIQNEEPDPSDEFGTSIPITIPMVGTSSEEKFSTLIFRGDDPRIWNSDFQDPDGNFAMPLSQLPEGIKSIRLKRLDSGESVEIPVTREILIAGGGRNESKGWSGKGEHYFGSMHLGIFDESLSHTVETKFGAGGWGFGHRYEIGSGQAFAWEGKEIEPVRFEITVQTDDEGTTPTQQGSVDDSTGSSREISGLELPETGLILFRSNDPTLWNQTIYRGANQRARSLAELNDYSEIQWLKLTRCDTREAVIVRTDKGQLRGDSNGSSSGFNASNEVFYGAHHLGVFDSGAKLDVETRFTFGGWGFGHRNSTVEEESQAWGWAGEEIPAGTVLEIAVFSELPEVGEKDTVIGGAES